MLTHSRKSNVAMIALNKCFGFRVVRTIRGYYEDPVESSVEMELVLLAEKPGRRNPAK